MAVEGHEAERVDRARVEANALPKHVEQVDELAAQAPEPATAPQGRSAHVSGALSLTECREEHQLESLLARAADRQAGRLSRVSHDRHAVYRSSSSMWSIFPIAFANSFSSAVGVP